MEHISLSRKVLAMQQTIGQSSLEICEMIFTLSKTFGQIQAWYIFVSCNFK